MFNSGCVCFGTLLPLLANRGNSDFCSLFYVKSQSQSPLFVCAGIFCSGPSLERCVSSFSVSLCQFWFSFGARIYYRIDFGGNEDMMQKGKLASILEN